MHWLANTFGSVSPWKDQELNLSILDGSVEGDQPPDQAKGLGFSFPPHMIHLNYHLEGLGLLSSYTFSPAQTPAPTSSGF